MVLLTTILGLLSLAISFFIFSYAMLAQHGNSDRILFLSLVYLGCGGALLVVRGIAAFFHNRMSPGSSSSSAPKEDFYNPSSSRRRRRSGRLRAGAGDRGSRWRLRPPAVCPRGE